MDYMINRLDVMEQRLAQIDEKLSSSSTSFAEARELNKERATMEEACSLYKEYKTLFFCFFDASKSMSGA